MINIELAFIAPTSYLEEVSSKGDFYLALAHLVDDNGENEYASFHRREAEKGRRVILDNGLFEGASVDPESLIQRARAIGAQTVFAPDVLFDSKATIKAFKQFVKLKHEEGLVFDIAGVPQADNPVDWWECFQFMDLHPECALIGLSILSIPKAFGRRTDAEAITSPRVRLIKQLYQYSDLSGRRLTPMHLLGLGESYDDIIEARKLLSRDIVSNDSSSCFVHGMNDVEYEPNGKIPGGKIKTKVDFGMANRYKMLEYATMLANMIIAKDIAHGDIDYGT